MDYVPHSEADIFSILKEMNIGNIEDLYSGVPEKIKIKSCGLGRGLSEFELKTLIRKKAEKNLAV
ncbi:MAG: glycine dehydrogenase, partial [Candidatus Aureabacteria bacterium]|nr:glycine dehydrogenase [Candidatus Auribacterota bacterium]